MLEKKYVLLSLFLLSNLSQNLFCSSHPIPLSTKKLRPPDMTPCIVEAFNAHGKIVYRYKDQPEICPFPDARGERAGNCQCGRWHRSKWFNPYHACHQRLLIQFHQKALCERKRENNRYTAQLKHEEEKASVLNYLEKKFQHIVSFHESDQSMTTFIISKYDYIKKFKEKYPDYVTEPEVKALVEKYETL